MAQITPKAKSYAAFCGLGFVPDIKVIQTDQPVKNRIDNPAIMHFFGTNYSEADDDEKQEVKMKRSLVLEPH